MARLTIEFIDKKKTVYEVKENSAQIYSALKYSNRFIFLTDKEGKTFAINSENTIEINWEEE